MPFGSVSMCADCTFLGGITYYYGTNLKYIAVKVNTTINDAEFGYTKGIPLRDKWEEVISREVFCLLIWNCMCFYPKYDL